MTTKLLTPTGRAATSQPEIQNIPMHTPDGDAIRRAFCAPLVPEGDVARNADAISRELNPILPEVIDSLNHVITTRDSRLRKYERLQEIQVRVSNIIEPYTPCSQGCSYCCHMAVVLSEYEAGLIAKFLDRPYVKQPRLSIDELSVHHEQWLRDYTNVPCTLLTPEGKCSVYPVRPFACRTHHTIAPDNKCCDLTYMQVTPMVDLGILEKTYVGIFRDQPFGEIREYLPKEESHE